MKEIMEYYGESLIGVFSMVIFLGAISIFIIEPVKECVMNFLGVLG